MKTWTRQAGRAAQSLAAACGLALLAAAAQAATVASVHSFSNIPDGAAPEGGLVKGADGALYGTTQYGGIYGIDPATNSGNGTIFRIGTENEYNQLYSFTFLGSDLGNVDGRWPGRALLAAPDGSLYGVTPFGGDQDGGAVFKFAPATGTLTPLHYFDASTAAPGGSKPVAPLALGADGRLYGSTEYGGRTQQALGTLFALQPDGSGFSVLKSFGRGAEMPNARLLAASDGMLYGVASSYHFYPGGALFRVAPDGSKFRVLHQFDYATEGGYYYVGPGPALVEGPAGYLYGATSDGGTGEGAIFRVRPSGRDFQILHAFPALGSGRKNSGGGQVQTTPVFGPDGLLYGATVAGGANGTGTLFRMAPDGSAFTTLYEFPAAAGQAAEPSGMYPSGDVVFNAKGQLCGTTSAGGLYQAGTVYCMTPD